MYFELSIILSIIFLVYSLIVNHRKVWITCALSVAGTVAVLVKAIPFFAEKNANQVVDISWGLSICFAIFFLAIYKVIVNTKFKKGFYKSYRSICIILMLVLSILFSVILFSSVYNEKLMYADEVMKVSYNNTISSILMLITVSSLYTAAVTETLVIKKKTAVTSKDFKKEDDGKNFAIYYEVEGEVYAEITYTKEGKDTYVIDHTFVDDKLRGKGVASKLVNEAVKDITRKGGNVKATCSYAKTWLERSGKM